MAKKPPAFVKKSPEKPAPGKPPMKGPQPFPPPKKKGK